MELGRVTSILKTKILQVDAVIFDELHRLKTNSVINGQEEVANELWFYETVARIKSDFLQVYSLLKDDEYDKYETVWCLLEHIEIAFGNIRDNYPERLSEFHLSNIETTIFNLQNLFPYRIFMSREMVVKRSQCSICHKETSIRHPCSHKVGKLYAGELCCTMITDADFLAISFVTKPFDKYCVPYMEGTQYNYGILQHLMKKWDNPYDKWYVEVLDVLKPEYRNTGRNTPCPCGSGKKYKHCCFDTPDEKMEHFRLTFENKTFEETPMVILGTTISSK